MTKITHFLSRVHLRLVSCWICSSVSTRENKTEVIHSLTQYPTRNSKNVVEEDIEAFASDSRVGSYRVKRPVLLINILRIRIYFEFDKGTFPWSSSCCIGHGYFSISSRKSRNNWVQASPQMGLTTWVTLLRLSFPVGIISSLD